MYVHSTTSTTTILIRKLLLLLLLLSRPKILNTHTYIHNIMKARVCLSIDVDCAEALQKEKNQSDLINSYLRNNYKLGPIKKKQIMPEEK